MRKRCFMAHFISYVVLLCMLIAPLSFASDLKITRRTTAPEALTTNTTYIQGPRVRHEARPVNGYQVWSGGPWVSLYGHRFATILQCDRKQAISIMDLEEYTTYAIDDLGRPLRNQTAPVPISPVKTEPSGATLHAYVDDVDTGERKTMFGYTVRHIIRAERRVPGSGAVSQAQEIKGEK